MADQSIQVTAPAKVNLNLQITGRRKDGYHTLDSAVVFADIEDKISLEPASELQFECLNCRDKAVPDGEENIVVQATREFCRIYNFCPDLKIILEKTLPAAAGLGGGSSDAAAVIRGLYSFFDMTPVTDKHKILLLSLGADLPACYERRSLRMRGVGEDISYQSFGLEGCGIVLVNPRKPCSTKDVFENLNLESTSKTPPKNIDLAYIRQTGNDLFSVAVQIVPEIKDILNVISRSRNLKLHGMTGSGASCFAIYETPNEARIIGQKLRLLYREWWVKYGKILDGEN